MVAHASVRSAASLARPVLGARRAAVAAKAQPAAKAAVSFFFSLFSSSIFFLLP